MSQTRINQPCTKRRAAIVGCGLIGESWAALMSAHGCDVALWDPSPGALDGLPSRIARARKAVVSGPHADNDPGGEIIIAASLEDAVSGADWIQENAPESLSVKTRLYKEIERAAPHDTIIASSTSSLTWSQLAPAFERPQRFITAHPFNPPHLMPLVEIYASCDKTRRESIAFYEGLDRRPVSLKRDVVGHIANRLSSALWREAVNLVAEGIADVSAVDAAMTNGPGLRWAVVGPHMAYHLGGGPGGMESYLKHLGPSQERRWETLGTPRLTPEICAQLIDGVEDEAAGRSVDSLAAARDQALIRMLHAREDKQ